MHRTRTLSSLDTDDGADCIISSPPVPMKDRLRRFFGLPKPMSTKNTTCENLSWGRLLIVGVERENMSCISVAATTLLCATIFLEDAVQYQSIAHKVTKFYLLIYRWFSSPLVRR